MKRRRCTVLLLTIKKPYDLVDRSSLWCKLIAHGINGKVINVIYNLYLNAKSCILSESKISDSFKCNIGVRQGENLSPKLFAMVWNVL